MFNINCFLLQNNHSYATYWRTRGPPPTLPLSHRPAWPAASGRYFSNLGPDILQESPHNISLKEKRVTAKCLKTFKNIETHRKLGRQRA